MSNKARSINGERTEQVADQAPEDGPKLYREGTHRIVSPEGTLARMKPLAERMGITRLAVLTGLDRIGIPVAAAVRHSGRAAVETALRTFFARRSQGDGTVRVRVVFRSYFAGRAG